MPLESLAQAMNRISAEVRGGPLSGLRMAEGGAVYDPMGNVSVPPSEGFAPSPAYESIADALARTGAAVGRPTVGALETAARVYSDKSREAAAENEELRQQAMRNMQGELGYAGMPLGAGQMLLSQLGTATLPLTAAAKTAGYAATQATGNPRFGENVEMLSGFVDPSHIGMLKAAAPMAGAAAARQAVQTARELSPLGLYSHGAEAALAMPQAKGSPEQMVAQLRSAGVRPAELFSTGIADEAATNALRTKIESEMSPRIAQAEEALKSLTPGTKEFKDAERQLNNLKGTMRSEMDRALVIAPDWASRPSVTREEIAQHLHEQMPVVEERVLGGKSTVEFTPEMERRLDDLTEKRISTGLTEEEMAEKNRLFLLQVEAQTGLSKTKFQQYTLPGGENYREVLLRLGEKENPKADAIYEQMFPYYKTPNGTLTPEFKALKAEYDALTQRSDFKSQHWDDPNVLAHIRMADRTGPNGEKILHVEELQSDWGQKGKKEGFADTSQNWDQQYKDFQKKAVNDWVDMKASNAFNQNPELYGSLENAREVAQTASKHYGMSRIAEDLGLSDVHSNLYDKMNQYRNGLPTAPYVTSTEGWTDLALKRVLKEAAEGGYDRVVFTPGAEQAKRYDLSKHVERVAYDPEEKTLSFVRKGGPGWQDYGGSVEPGQLAGIIGKDAAEKLLSTEPSKLSGIHNLETEGLTFGGEGMKAYYDKMVPKRLQELARRHDKGAKVGKTDVLLPPEAGERGSNNPPIETMGITITPQMRESILRGQPHMAEGGPVYDPMGNVTMPPEEGFAPSPAYENIADALARTGAAVGRPVTTMLRGAAEIPGTVTDYFAEKSQQPDPSQRIAEDIRTFGGKFLEHAVEHPVDTALDLMPVIGEIRSGMDAANLTTKAEEAEILGDFDKARTFRQLAAVAAAGAAPLAGTAARIAKRGAKTAEELARVSHDVNAISKEADAAKLADNAPEAAEAAAIAKEFEPPHNPDTIGAEKKAEQPITGGNEDFQFTALEREKREKGFARITSAERVQIENMARDAKVDPKKAVEAVREKRKQYPTSDGWAPFEVVGFEKDAKGGVKLNDEGLPELKIKQEAYQFHQKAGDEKRIAEGKWDQQHVDELSDKLVKEVEEVANRADKGDKNASVIMAARNWYAAMRDRLRQEYGGFADVMADVLGTTSAQTNVRQNWENTIEVLSQFSRGAYDRALTKLDDWLEAGGEMGSAGTKDGNGYINGHLRDLKDALPDARLQAKSEGLSGKAAEDRAKEIAFQKAQEGEFPLITKADGKTLFNANSPQTMMALLDEFRKRKAGDAPKTPNFTGNLIGYSDKATIDVWAARLLRRLSGRDRLIPDAESGVGGVYLASPLESGINVGGEFGFGQEVFQKAAEKLRKDPRFKNLGDDDLQAIAWFLEKEQWGKKGYTTKSGEGGSLELEANFAGVSDRDALKEQRRLAETDPTFGERQNIKKELADPKTQMERETANAFFNENSWILDYKTPAQRRNAVMEREGLDKAAAADRAETLYGEVRAAHNVEKKIATKENRLATLEERAQSVPAQARASLDEMQAIARRFTGGLSPDRPDMPAMPEMFVEGNKTIIDPLKKDPEVMMMKATPSQGRYIDPQGNVYDEPAYDLEFVTRQNFDPQPTFRNMVKEAKKRNQESTFLSEVVQPGTVENANPGAEIYFTKKVGQDVVDRLTQTINQLGVDAGFTFVTDFRAKNRAAGGENVGEYVGIRVQYIPEFGGGVEGVPTAQKKILNAINQITSFDGVSSARYVEYDTQVLFRDQYDGYLAGNVSDGLRTQWARQPSREGNQKTNRSAGVLERAVGGAVVHRGRDRQADAGGQKGQTSLASLLKLAAEHGLHRPQIAAILRQNDPRLSPVQATARAREIMAGDTEALRGILSDKLMAELRRMLKGARP